MAVLEPGPDAEAWRDQEGNRKNPRTTPTTDTPEAADADADDETTRKVGKLDLLPRRHVGRWRPQYRVELRLGRRQIIQVGVAKRF